MDDKLHVPRKSDDGKAIRATRRGFPTLKAAKLEATKLQAAFDNGEYNKKPLKIPFRRYMNYGLKAIRRPSKSLPASPLNVI